jgi:hypothetical protein
MQGAFTLSLPSESLRAAARDVRQRETTISAHDRGSLRRAIAAFWRAFSAAFFRRRLRRNLPRYRAAQKNWRQNSVQKKTTLGRTGPRIVAWITQSPRRGG